VLLARLAAAQAPGATVSGVVRDSIARAPLAGAVVQLVAADSQARFGRTVVSDSLGRFMLADVPAGRYMIGFFHAMLDSLGVEPPLREVRVDGRRPVRADLAIPSPAGLRAAICGQQSAPESGAVVIGIVRDARNGGATAGVTVTGEWLEFSFAPEQRGWRTQRLTATTAENGWFALCNVPGAGTIALRASRGTDSTDLIEMQVPAERFLRRELYLGSSLGLVSGDGRLSGTVVTAAEGRPLAGAVVSIADGHETRANERGEWTLVDAPVGTRMLEVRAVGYYAERSAVDVVAGAPPIRTALSTIKAMLDTVRITASRLNEQMKGFEQRRHGGMGRYLTPEDIARRGPIVTSDLFRMVPGFRVDRSGLGETRISMRGPFAGRCSPAVYLDGNYVGVLSADDIDQWVNPGEIAGIEIYTGPGVPPQFTTGMATCGSIVIWTKPSAASSYRTSWKARIAKVIGLVALALLIGELFNRR